MSFNDWFMLICVLLFIPGYWLVKKKKSKYGRFLIVAAIVFFIFGTHLPGRTFGGWNSIKPIKGKVVSRIILRPSLPRWEVNLTDTSFLIEDSTQIARLVVLLKDADMCFPSHPIRTWETEILMITKENDSLSVVINQTEDDGTVIYRGRKEFRNDSLGKYLEKLTNYSAPQYGQKEDRVK